MKLKELRAAAKRAGRKIKIKAINFEGRESRKFIEIVPSLRAIFSCETERLDYINSLNEAEKELFYWDIDKIEKELNIK
jgi:hypothetical protein